MRHIAGAPKPAIDRPTAIIAKKIRHHVAGD
jgi:hypothetical protein